jgi:hypothetical protein
MPRETDAPSGAAFWAGSAIGLGMLGFGVYGLLDHHAQTMPLNWLTFFLGSVLLHDAVWAPVVGLASLALVRLVPRRVRPALQGTLVVTAAVLLVATPALTGRGRNPNNPSILPGHYGTDTLKVLAIVWAVGALLTLRALRRAVDPPGPPALPPVPNGW